MFFSINRQGWSSSWLSLHGLTRKAAGAGDPSLRLKNGCAQDDNTVSKAELHHHRMVLPGLTEVHVLELRFAMPHEKSSSGAGFVGCFADR